MTNSRGYAVTGSNAGSPEAFVDQGLEREGLGSKRVNVQELPLFLGVGYIGGDTTESGIVVRPGRPYLHIDLISLTVWR